MAKAWMPMYWGDFKANTSHLSTLERGAYLMLIAHYWETGSLPSDEKRIRRIAGLTAAQWKRSAGALKSFFYDGWRHRRIDDELDAKKLISTAARHKAEKRWKNNNPPRAAALPQQCDSQSQSQSQDKKESKKGVGDWVVNETHRAIAKQLGVNVEAEETKFRDYIASHGKRYSDYDATFRNWLKNSQKFNGGTNGAETDRERRKRESREALDKLKAFGEGRGDGDFCAPTLRLLPPTGTSGES